MTVPILEYTFWMVKSFMISMNPNELSCRITVLENSPGRYLRLET